MSRLAVGAHVVVCAMLLTSCVSDGEPTLSAPSASAAPSEAESPDTRGAQEPASSVETFDPSAFAAVRDEPIPKPTATELDDLLVQYAEGFGMTATVMSPAGTWSGATGMADTSHSLRPTDQFAIGSITKSVFAAQVMRLVETGDVALDDPVADHLPPNLDFDTNGATIRQLLSMTSGIPDYVDALWRSLSTDRERRWTTAELLDLVRPKRTRPGKRWEYSSTNYILLQLMVEHVRGRRASEVLRHGVLSGPGLERMAFQPDERPSGPVATSDAGRHGLFAEGGGYLPSLAGATAAQAAGGIASDSATLARWWTQFCGGEIVSPVSLKKMAAHPDPSEEYALGLLVKAGSAEPASLGMYGVHVGFSTWASCYADGVVVVALSNQEEADPFWLAEALAAAIREK